MLPARLPPRFEVVRELGRGGMGAVYEAIDREGGGRVAIKLLPSDEPDAITRFKREFRALQDIHHPNLVALGELLCERGQWAFSMDLVDGVDFIEYVAERRRELPSDLELDALTVGLEPAVSPAVPPPVTSPSSGVRALASPAVSAPPGFDEDRLRDALYQLTAGLAALHAANKVHRDIKPSNIRVRGDGHLVLLDFGLVIEASSDERRTEHRNVLGTPAYMAPEQASGGPLGAPADLYALGVVLFEALTGQLPFMGNPLQMMQAKQQHEAPRVRSLVPSVPEDLDALCARLLAFDPAQRPTAEATLRTLRPAARPIPKARPHDTQSNVAPTFVGRKDHLALLEQALATVLGGSPAAVLIEGESGTGKSYLARQFLDRLQLEHPKALVVTGRCYENEAIPYNAWDGAIESLSAHWQRLPAEEAAVLLPLHVAPLAQTFPALRRVPAVTRAITGMSPKIDPREVRSRAFSALRELFERAAHRAPLVVFLDDLQWADYDSISLLAEVLREPYPPPLLFLATTRPLADYPDVGRELRDVLPRTTRRCSVGQLPPAEAIELARQLLQRGAPELVDEAASIATEANGHPLFIAELTRHFGLTGLARRGSLSLEAALWARVTQLTDEARSLLTVLSLAARPLPEAVAVRAANVPPTTTARALSALRVGHLTRAVRIDGVDWLETYHDRVRAAVVERTEPEARRLTFERIAYAFEGNVHADANLLTDFWKAAGDAERAGRHARDAGDQAAAAFAFDRAAAFYQTALERPSCTRDERHALLVLLGDTLAKAGRGEEAAASYQRALEGAKDHLEALELDHRAGEQLLRTGHYDAGIELITRVLARVGLRWPRSAFQAVVAFVLLRVSLFVRGQRFTARKEAELTRQELTRVDVCFNIGTWLVMADPIRAMVFQMHNLRLALRAGELGRVSLGSSTALARAGALNGGRSPSRLAKLQKQIVRAGALADSVGRYERAYFDIAAGMALISACRPREGIRHLQQGERVMRDECWGKTWEIVTSQLWAIRGCFYLGELAQLVMSQSRALQEASDRRDLYGTIHLRIGFCNFAWLVRDDPEGATDALAHASNAGRAQGATLERHYSLLARTNIALYRGGLDEAWTSIEEEWAVVRGSPLRHIATVRFQSNEYRARACLARAEVKAADRQACLEMARRCTREVERAQVAYAVPTADLLRAQLRAALGDDVGTVAMLRRAVDGLAAIDLGAHAAVARRALGKVLRGDEGAALVRSAEDFLRAQSVKSIPAFCRTLAPGLARFE